jgi:phosphoenolpyruvate synthase/pyruvate phosphate dikinase
MPSIYTLPLVDGQATAAKVGGKGASLARLAAAGLPVPDGFHITTCAYGQFVTDRGLREQIMAAVSAVIPDQPTTLQEASVRIAEVFARSEIPKDIADAICMAYAGLGKGEVPVAVALRQRLKTSLTSRLPVSRTLI